MTLSAAIADKPLWNVLAIGPAEKGFRKVCQLWQHRRCAPSGMGVPRSPIPARNQAPGGAPDGAIMEPGEVALGSVKDSCVPVRVRPACVLVLLTRDHPRSPQLDPVLPVELPGREPGVDHRADPDQ
jgi:hypothetical protein